MIENIIKSLPYDSSTFEFGLVEDFIYILDDGSEKTSKEIAAGKDTEISKKFSGYVTVKKFIDNVVVKALYIVPMAGSSMFLGGMPERGSVCFMCRVVASGENTSRVILGFIPVPMNMMIMARHEMDHMVEGEMLFQGATYDSEVKDFYSSASMKSDVYGRLVIENGTDDFKIIVGDLLSNEYTEEVDYLKDSITGEVVCFYESYKGKYSRSIDKSGNTIFRTLSALWDVMGDDIRRISGRFIVSSNEQIRLEQNGSYMDISKDGFDIACAKDFVLNIIGGGQINSGSFLALSSFLNLSLSTSSSAIVKALQEILLSSGSKITLSSAAGGIIIEALGEAGDVSISSLIGNVGIDSTAGKVEITAALTASLKAKGIVTVDGSKVNLGSGAQPVLKGTQTQTDLLTHMHMGNFGYPTSPSPAASPMAFLNILSTKSFTE